MRSRIAVKRRIRGLAVLLMLAVMIGLTPTAFADDDDDDDDERGGRPSAVVDFTFGKGTADFGLPPPAIQATFDFDAQSGPNGELATGFARLTDVSGNSYSGPVTCLNVQGSRAVFEVDNTLGGDVVVFVGDFGVGPNVDEFNFDPIAEADATCPGTADRENSVVTGDIVVGDNQSVRRGGDDDDEGGRLRLRRGGDD
jgi:hypothetical protein